MMLSECIFSLPSEDIGHDLIEQCFIQQLYKPKTGHSASHPQTCIETNSPSLWRIVARNSSKIAVPPDGRFLLIASDREKTEDELELRLRRRSDVVCWTESCCNINSNIF